MRNIRLPVAFVLCLVVTASAHAVINPMLQPSHLADRYLNVLSCRVTAVDTRALTVGLAVQGVSKGDFTAQEIVMSIRDKSLADAILTLQKGQTIVAYAGKSRRRHEADILYYVGGGVWYTATMADGADKWTVLANADAGRAGLRRCKPPLCSRRIDQQTANTATTHKRIASSYPHRSVGTRRSEGPWIQIVKRKSNTTRGLTSTGV